MVFLPKILYFLIFVFLLNVLLSDFLMCLLWDDKGIFFIIFILYVRVLGLSVVLLVCFRICGFEGLGMCYGSWALRTCSFGTPLVSSFN